MAIGKILAAAAAALSLFATAAAQSVTPSSLRADPFSALVGKRKPAAERAAEAGVDRYVIATGDRVFLFQSSNGIGRLKFLCAAADKRPSCALDEAYPAEEIHLLTASRVSRGDVVWRGADGRAVLRIAAYGGVTVFWPGEERGHAAAKSFGEDPPLTLDFLPLEAAEARARTATAIVSARVGAPIVFNLGRPALDARGGVSVLSDAIARTVDGIADVADDPTGARVIAARIREVAFQAQSGPGLNLEGGALIVGYDPAGDAAGRPSSARIARFLEESL